MGLGEAIRKMTSLPAATYAIPKRGQLQVGFYADIAIFSAKNVVATANFEQPHQLAKGFDWVLVNGKVSWQTDRQIGKFGQALRKAQL